MTHRPVVLVLALAVIAGCRPTAEAGSAADTTSPVTTR